MKHTSYAESGGVGPTQYDWLLQRLNATARVSKGPVYVVGIERVENDATAIRDMCKDIPEARRAMDVNGTVDVIVAGDSHKAEEVGRAIFRCTGQPVGGVRYDPEDEGVLYLNLRSAIKAAMRADSPFHEYDSSRDSLQAKTEEVRKELAGK
ncbi:hypothetical protein KY360_04915 [Candidatus Woesearchaeota archaeon]|nr:hypothetical protein [Candidatus Woesearchaeota archaeon]